MPETLLRDYCRYKDKSKAMGAKREYWGLEMNFWPLLPKEAWTSNTEEVLLIRRLTVM